MPTVSSMMVASALGSPVANRFGMNAVARDATINDVTMALISDHALIRHQYQRRIRTSPVPAPRARRNFHACSIELSCQVTTMEARNRKIVAHRETVT